MEVFLGKFDKRRINTLGRVLEPLGFERVEGDKRTALAFLKEGDWHNFTNDSVVRRYDGDSDYPVAIHSRGSSEFTSNIKLYETVKNHLNAKLVAGIKY